MNSICIVGNLTREPEIKKSQNNKDVAYYTVAVRRDSENTDFINCVAYDKMAENVMRFLHKGYKVGVHGSLSVRAYKDKNGNNATYVSVITNNIDFMQAKKNENSENKNQAKNNSYNSNGSYGFEGYEGNEDLPF